WGYGSKGFDSVYPARALFALSESGGFISGAYIRDKLVAFSAAWIGLLCVSHDFWMDRTPANIVWGMLAKGLA
ncbi:MAG: hypothetical protein AB8I58_24170, partial [Anaerolineales bacterium]